MRFFFNRHYFFKVFPKKEQTIVNYFFSLSRYIPVRIIVATNKYYRVGLIVNYYRRRRERRKSISTLCHEDQWYLFYCGKISYFSLFSRFLIKIVSNLLGSDKSTEKRKERHSSTTVRKNSIYFSIVVSSRSVVNLACLLSFVTRSLTRDTIVFDLQRNVKRKSFFFQKIESL